MTTTTVKIAGMSCGHCVMHVKKALQEVPGLKELQVEVGKATIATEGAADLNAIKAAIEEAGYEVVSAS